MQCNLQEAVMRKTSHQMGWKGLGSQFLVKVTVTIFAAPKLISSSDIWHENVTQGSQCSTPTVGSSPSFFDTYCRIWRAGGQASLTTSTKDGLVEANLKLQLGPPAAARAGAPPPSQRLFSPSSSPGNPGAARRQPCHRGPAAKAKSRARAA